MTAPPPHDAPGSELSVNDILQCTVHQGKISVHPLEPGALVLQLPQLRQLRDRHARILALSLVVGWFAHAVLVARLAGLGTQLDLVEDCDDLAFTASGFLHVRIPLVGMLCFRLAQDFEVASDGLTCFEKLKRSSVAATGPLDWPRS